jgi:GLPGLI family protein
MKKIFLAATVALLSFTTINNNTNFEGKVVYDISLDGSGLPPEAMSMFKGSEMVTYIKGDKRRVDMNMPMQSTTTISDNKTKLTVMLMDIMGMKYLIKMTEADLKKEQDEMPDVKIKTTTETKTIAGYKCVKNEVQIKTKEGKEETVNVWTTDEIPTSEVKTVYKGLKGFPLEYSLNQRGLKMTFTTKEISKELVADSKFDIPTSGYTETTMSDFKKSMEKMGGK